MSEFRQDPVTGVWTLVVPERAGRPKDFSRPPEESGDADTCPLCRGREHLTPPTIAERRLPGESGWTTRVVNNKYPALGAPPESLGCDDVAAPEPYAAVTGFGGHELIVETPRHGEGLAEYSPEHARLLVDTVVDRVRHWHDDGRVAITVLFRNWGAAAGASLAHAHTQLVALPRVPNATVRELGNFVGYAETHGGACVLCAAIAADEAGGRTVFDDGITVVQSPYAAPIPYALRIAPRDCSAGILGLTSEQRDSLGASLTACARAYDRGFGDPAFNMMWHLAPYRVADTSALPYHWHVDAMLRTSDQAGYEWATGGYLNQVDPDDAASSLRDALHV
jgi:UDPglucose--hexose-1-phosphate uridylyltransferase